MKEYSKFEVHIRHIDDLTGDGKKIGDFSLDEIGKLIAFFKRHKTYFLEYDDMDICSFAGTQFVVGEEPHLEILVKEQNDQ